MAYPLSDAALQWQRKARAFADEVLMPHEETAEFNEGELPPAVYEHHKRQAMELGFPLMDAPLSYGGLALPMLTQVVVWEQLGRVTNALSWCMSEVHAWMFEACNADQIERYILPMMQGQRRECYAITEAEAGSRLGTVDATLVRCGHSHLQRDRVVAGVRVLNPGSAGVPAFDDDHPFPHVAESGSPHARYALIEVGATSWRATSPTGSSGASRSRAPSPPARRSSAWTSRRRA